MKKKSKEKETLKYLNEISRLWNKIDKLTIENKMLKNDIKRLNMSSPYSTNQEL